MFNFPEPPPIDFYLDDVAPSFLTDGVFMQGRLAPSHKCIAKQLRPIKRRPSDPVAPPAEVNARTLEKWANDEKASYVDDCGRNARALYAMMKLLPAQKVDLYRGWKSRVAPFPRSERYEYAYLREERINDWKETKKTQEEIPCVEVNRARTTNAAFDYTPMPFWWKNGTPRRIAHTVGSPNDYKFDRPDQPEMRDEPIRERPQPEHTEARSPDAFHGTKHPEGAEMREAPSRTDAAKVEAQVHTEAASVDAVREVCRCTSYATTGNALLSYEKNNGVSRTDRDDDDPRWHPLCDVTAVPKNAAERAAAMMMVQKPYLHELNTWYARNKPTKIGTTP